ncbi:MAG: hypothetical protein LBD10_14755 [Desulfobulbus sp.]|jgi:hypothetical protein|uniref:hypothetical protein n=1 Tax=Desulfobulbus sp. TaxID=895 RepID=UPI002845109F|nr:hypothetical protein [Desulfobulbus sp.]MDR2551448.1 hypothetical protein [Desulfobulbus sp.]
MSKYLVLQPLSHDQKKYAAGDTVELAEEQAMALLAVAVVGEVPKEGKGKSKEIGE